MDSRRSLRATLRVEAKHRSQPLCELKQSTGVDPSWWWRQGFPLYPHSNMLIVMTLQDTFSMSVFKLCVIFLGTTGFSAEAAVQTNSPWGPYSADMYPYL
ncbi:hypothetical protein ACLOJK_028699 [Asimina triloba]